MEWLFDLLMGGGKSQTFHCLMQLSESLLHRFIDLPSTECGILFDKSRGLRPVTYVDGPVVGESFHCATLLFLGRRFHCHLGKLGIFCLSDLTEIFGPEISHYFFHRPTDVSVCYVVICMFFSDFATVDFAPSSIPGSLESSSESPLGM